jgi:hypothetical protein
LYGYNRPTLGRHLSFEAGSDLHIGTSKNLDEGSFFYGLIDDVRIYDVALTAEKIAALVQ